MEFLSSFKKTIIFIFVVIFNIAVISIAFTDMFEKEGNLEELKEVYSKEVKKPVDHSKFEELQKDFMSPHDITAACLSCHTERGTEVMNNAHWNWEREEYIEGRGIVYIGKKNVLNNFCTGIMSNEQSCNKCHIGYGWKDKDFDFSNQYNIDCIICHDNTGTYEKATGGAGYPPVGEFAPDYKKITASVGSPLKTNCGYCHFMSAGGNNIKHGDLETALLECDKNVDVHMAKDGLDMECVDCHSAENHVMKGKYYAVSSTNTNRASCTDCHDKYPHKQSKLNEHTVKVDCRTCHIPQYAKVNPTKMYWDWSTAGRRQDGMPYSIKDSAGNVNYLSEKGDFRWTKNVAPEYVWFNGTADHHLITDKITTDTVNINTLFGSYDDPNSKIVPVKVHRGKQPYDLKYKNLLQAKLWAPEEGQGALWKDLDWDIALKLGMEYVGIPYSGEYGFIPTRMYLPVSHMVSKSEEALTCNDCHSRENSRMKNVPGVYIPGTTYNKTLNTVGILFVLLSLGGVFGHASLRVLSGIRRNRKSKKSI
jgi:octaheme c-type cytochrome (tetrathionate reductase family)